MTDAGHVAVDGNGHQNNTTRTVITEEQSKLVRRPHVFSLALTIGEPVIIH